MLKKVAIVLLLALTSCASQGGALKPDALSVQRSAAVFVKSMESEGGLAVSDETGLDVLFSADGRYVRFESRGTTLFADLEEETLLVPYAAVKDILSDGQTSDEELATIEASAPLFADGAMLEVRVRSMPPPANAGRQFARLLEIRNSTVTLVRMLSSDPSALAKEVSKSRTVSGTHYALTMDMKAVFHHLDLGEDSYLRYVSNELGLSFEGRDEMLSGPSFSPPLLATLAGNPLPEFWNGKRVSLDELESSLVTS